MYKHTSELFSNASNARAWESCDCDRNVIEERVFHLDSFAVRGDPQTVAGSASSGDSSSDNRSSGSGFLSASFKFIGPGYKQESPPALRAAVQVLQVLMTTLLHSRLTVHRLSRCCPMRPSSSITRLIAAHSPRFHG
jgi:hypothetical protein